MPLALAPPLALPLVLPLATSGAPPEPREDSAPQAAPAADAGAAEWESEDMDAWLSGMEDGDPGDPEDPEDPEDSAPAKAPPRRDVATGAMRLFGGYLHAPDIPELYPNGDDGLGAGVLRMIVDQPLGEHLQYELNVFADLSRTPPISTGGTFTTAGQTESAYRTPHLTWAYWEDGAIRGSAGVDRFALRANASRFNFALGRFPVNYSVTSVFTPNDLFAPFAATAINRIYKPGVDAASASVGIGPLSAVEVVGVLGYDDDGALDWGRAALIARASAVVWNIEWAALGGKAAERWFAGVSMQGDVVGPLGFRAEGHVGFPDEDGDGSLDDDRDVYVRAAGGPGLIFTWQNATIGAEYLFQLDGAEEPEDYLERATRFYPDDIPYLGQHYVGVVAGLETIPILRVNALSLINAGDGSGLAGAFLAYNIADEADFVGGVYVPWGKKPDLAGFPLLPPSLGSEFGQSPLTVFLETRFYF